MLRHIDLSHMLRACVFVSLILIAASLAPGQTGETDAAGQIDRLFSNYNASTPGVAVAVVKDGKVVFNKGYGTANLELSVPITTRTVFQIASVSKQFTAFAVYLSEKQGKVSLEDDVRKYIPELPVYGKPVKLRHLLAHTSGVKDQAALMSLAGWRSGDVATTGQVVRLLSRQKELNFEPGSQYLYSNSGYTLLAEVVSRASGQSFAAYTRKHIFEPLGMNDTQFNDEVERIMPRRADSYELVNGAYKKKPLNDVVAGPSNLYTTIEDLAKWVLNFEKPLVGDVELIRRFDEPSLLDNGERVVYAVYQGNPGYHAKGQILWHERGVKRFSHGGHAAGFRSFLGRFPDQRLSVIALSNDEHYQNADTSMKIAEIYLKDLQPEPVLKPSPATSKPVAAFKNELADFEGRFYNADMESAYHARVANGRLVLSHLRHGDIELKEEGKDKFSGRIGFPVQIEFNRSDRGTVIGLRISNWGARNVKFEKTTN